jgi:hypothetical protein
MKLSKEERADWSKEQKRFYKVNGYPMPVTTETALREDPTINLNSDVKVTVLCVRFGSKYGIEYVERLRNMVSRHLTLPYEMVCLTDDHHNISGVRSIIQKNSGYQKGWWHKVHMFDPNLDIQGRILYLDLDIIVCGNLNKLVQITGNGFYGIRDFNRKFYPSWNHLNSSVLCWTHQQESYIWNEFNRDRQNAMRLQGDQDWIWKKAKDRIKFWPNEWIQSYKWEIRSRDELVERTGKKGFKTLRNDIKPHSECSIAVFHGDPNPADVKDTFVVDNWR